MSQQQPHIYDYAERLVVVETKVTSLESDIKDILQTVKTIDDQMTRYKGFLGGITFILSAVGVFWSFGREWILNHWK